MDRSRVQGRQSGVGIVPPRASRTTDFDGCAGQMRMRLEEAGTV